MKCIQALFALVAITSVSARAFPKYEDMTLAIREALPYLDSDLESPDPIKNKTATGPGASTTKGKKNGNKFAKGTNPSAKASKLAAAAPTTATSSLVARVAAQDLTSGDLSSIDTIVEGLTGKDPGLKEKRAFSDAYIPTLTRKNKKNGTETADAASATGTKAEAKAAKKVAKEAAKESKASTAATAPAEAEDKRHSASAPFPIPELASRKNGNKKNGTTTTDPASGEAAAKAAKKAAKDSEKATKAPATPAAEKSKRNFDGIATAERTRRRTVFSSPKSA